MGNDHLARLGPAVKRARREVGERKTRRESEQAQALLSAIVTSSDDAIIGKEFNKGITHTFFNRGSGKRALCLYHS